MVSVRLAALAVPLLACTASGGAPSLPSSSLDGGEAGTAPEPPDASADDGAKGIDWHNCNGTAGPRSCASMDLHPYDSARHCFDAALVHVPELCFVCTIEYASASIAPVCGVDPQGRLFVFTNRPDLRLEAPGWRFGNRRDRGVYKDLEPDLLTPSERESCLEGASDWFDGGVDGHLCHDALDAGAD